MMYLMLVIGFVLLIKGADLFVDGSSGIAKILKVPGIIIGLTIVAMGTSLPECAVSITAALSGNNDIALGNVVGSNFFNLLVVCGICAMLQKLPIDRGTLKKEFPFSIFAEVLLLFMAGDYLLHGKHAIKILSRTDGIILLVLFILFLLSTVKSALKARSQITEEDDMEDDGEDEGKKFIPPVLKDIIFILVGIVAIKYGGDFVVNSASAIAEKFGLSQNMISLTIVAVGTSLPELVTSIVAARKNELGMAVGNVVGSNIFNVLLVLGISSAIHPIAVTMYNIYDLIYLCVTSIIVWAFAYRKGEIKRPLGCAMVSIYVVYMVYVCIR